MPAAVLLYGEDPERTQWSQCSGALIGQSMVLTAAHCVHEREDWTFVVSFADDFAFQRSEASEIQVVTWEVHPEYVPGAGEVDVALLQLASVAPMEPFPWSVDPPSTAATARYSFVGYGGQEGDISRCLRMSNDVTELQLEALPGRMRGFVHPSIYSGDSGGPLLLDLGSGPIIVGVFSETNSVGAGSDVAFGSLAYFAKLQDEDWLRGAIPSEPVALPR